MKKSFICKDTRPCFAKDEFGRCLILEVGDYFVAIGDDTPTLKEVFDKEGKNKNFYTVRTEYQDGKCPFRKECRNDKVIRGELIRKGEHDCSFCEFWKSCGKGLK